MLTAGSALTAAATYGAASVHSPVWTSVCLFLGGMAAASCNTAGGRLVSGWFPPHQRGLAMGIRQTAQPLGNRRRRAGNPELAERGPRAGLMFPAVVCAVAALASAIGIINPPRKSRKTATEQELANPYRGSYTLWRIHAVGGLLMMPQAVTVTFMLVWLMDDHGWSVAAAGGMVTISQLLGAAGRIMVGRWSDRVGSRMRPVRIIAIATASTLFLLAFVDNHHGWSFRGAAHDRRVGIRGARQWIGGNRDHRIRRAILERTRAGRPEHHTAADSRRRAPAVRCVDRRGRLPAGLGAVRIVPAGGGAVGAGPLGPARPRS